MCFHSSGIGLYRWILGIWTWFLSGRWNLCGNLGLFRVIQGRLSNIYYKCWGFGVNVRPLKILLIARAQLLCCCRGVSWESGPVVAGWGQYIYIYIRGVTCPRCLTKRRTYHPHSVIYRHVSRQNSEKWFKTKYSSRPISSPHEQLNKWYYKEGKNSQSTGTFP